MQLMESVDAPDSEYGGGRCSLSILMVLRFQLWEVQRRSFLDPNLVRFFLLFLLFLFFIIHLLFCEYKKLRAALAMERTKPQNQNKQPRKTVSSKTSTIGNTSSPGRQNRLPILIHKNKDNRKNDQERNYISCLPLWCFLKQMGERLNST